MQGITKKPGSIFDLWTTYIEEFRVKYIQSIMKKLCYMKLYITFEVDPGNPRGNDCQVMHTEQTV